MKLIVNEDFFKGGDADGLTLTNLAKKHKVSFESLASQLAKGIEVEFEHTNNKRQATEIAMDHLAEIPDYYTRLVKMEKAAEE